MSQLQLVIWGERMFVSNSAPLCQKTRGPKNMSCAFPLNCKMEIWWWIKLYLEGCFYDWRRGPRAQQRHWRPSCFSEQEASPHQHQGRCWSHRQAGAKPCNNAHIKTQWKLKTETPTQSATARKNKLQMIAIEAKGWFDHSLCLGVFLDEHISVLCWIQLGFTINSTCNRQSLPDLFHCPAFRVFFNGSSIV